MDNMSLWNSVCKTDPKHTKKAKIGKMPITAVCPQSQREMATKVFGSYGMGWGIVPGSEQFTFYDYPDQTQMVHYTAVFFYIHPEREDHNPVKNEFPIGTTHKVAYVTNGGQGYLKVDDEWHKKCQTDALTKGLSFLGFNADVFLGKYDDNRYVQQVANEFTQAEQHEQQQKAAEADELKNRAAELGKFLKEDGWVEDSAKIWKAHIANGYQAVIDAYEAFMLEKNITGTADGK